MIPNQSETHDNTKPLGELLSSVVWGHTATARFCGVDIDVRVTAHPTDLALAGTIREYQAFIKGARPAEQVVRRGVALFPSPRTRKGAGPDAFASDG